MLHRSLFQGPGMRQERWAATPRAIPWTVAPQGSQRSWRPPGTTPGTVPAPERSAAPEPHCPPPGGPPTLRAMRWLFIISGAMYIGVGFSTSIHREKWFNTHWGWITAVYVLALVIWWREHHHAQTTQRLLARLVRLERATVGLVYMHDDGPAHDAFLRERQERRFDPGEDIVRRARADADEFRSKAISSLFFPDDP